MKKPSESTWHWVMGRMRAYFLAGLLVVVPVAIAVLVLVWVFNSVDDILQPIIKDIFGRNIIGLGFAVTLVLVYVTGLIASNYFGKRLIKLGDAVLQRVPLFRQVYSGAKQVMEGLSGTGAISKAAFREVVLVEFPTQGMRTVAFITNEFTTNSGEKLYAVYIPTTPVPTSGFSGLLTEDKFTRTNISVDEALRMVISGIMIAPSSIQIKDGGQCITLLPNNKAKTEAEKPESS